MCTKLRTFFKKWENEKWLIVTILVVIILGVLVTGKFLILQERFPNQLNYWESFNLLLVDFSAGVILFICFGVIYLLSLTVGTVLLFIGRNIGGGVITFMKNEPGKFTYPIGIPEWTKTCWDAVFNMEKYLIGKVVLVTFSIVSILVFVFGYISAPFN